MSGSSLFSSCRNSKHKAIIKPKKTRLAKASQFIKLAENDLVLDCFSVGTVKIYLLGGVSKMMSKYPLLKSGTIVKLNLKIIRMKIIKANYTFVLDAIGAQVPEMSGLN